MATAPRTTQVTCTIIRKKKKKGKYIDPKGPGPKKDPVKTIALVVLPQQQPFHKYLSEELRVMFIVTHYLISIVQLICTTVQLMCVID